MPRILHDVRKQGSDFLLHYPGVQPADCKNISLLSYLRRDEKIFLLACVRCPP